MNAAEATENLVSTICLLTRNSQRKVQFKFPKKTGSNLVVLSFQRWLVDERDQLLINFKMLAFLFQEKSELTGGEVVGSRNLRLHGRSKLRNVERVTSTVPVVWRHLSFSLCSKPCKQEDYSIMAQRYYIWTGNMHALLSLTSVHWPQRTQKQWLAGCVEAWLGCSEQVLIHALIPRHCQTGEAVFYQQSWVH